MSQAVCRYALLDGDVEAKMLFETISVSSKHCWSSLQQHTREDNNTETSALRRLSSMDQLKTDTLLMSV